MSELLVLISFEGILGKKKSHHQYSSLPPHTHILCTHAKSLQSKLTLCDPTDCIPCQAPLSMGFSRQEYWSGLPCPPPGDLPDPGIEPMPLAWQADSAPLVGRTRHSGTLK